MSFTPSKNIPPNKIKRLVRYAEIRKGANPKTVIDRVFRLLTMMNVEGYDNLRLLQYDLIVIYIREYTDKSEYSTVRDIVKLTLKLESSIGRAIRKIREDEAMEFHPETYAGKSKKHEVSTELHGENIVEME